MVVPWPVRVIAAFGLMLLRTVPASAQGVGIVGGVNFAEINTSGDESLNVAFTDKMQPVFGLFLTFDAGNQLSIQPEALFSAKGSRVQLGSRDEQIRLSYIEVPVLLRYAGPKGSAVQVHVFGGPYAAFLVSATAQSSGSELRRDLDGVFETFDMGWVFGFGIGGKDVRMDLRFSGGVRDLAAGRDLGPIAPPLADIRSVKYRNRSLTLMAGYAF